MKDFIPYYLSQGCDMIYLLDDASTKPYDDCVTKNPKVKFISSATPRSNTKTSRQEYAHMLEQYKQIRHNTRWLILVDADEFMVTRRHPHKTIRQELKTTFKHADCIHVPWVMFGTNGHITDPISVPKQCTMRWNHDKRHPHPLKGQIKMRCRYDVIEVKSIFKPKKFPVINEHGPLQANRKTVVTVESVSNNRKKLRFRYYRKLREAKIAKAFFTCNHYRIYSEECMKRKCNKNSLLLRYREGNCLSAMKLADYNEVADNSMQQKVY